MATFKLNFARIRGCVDAKEMLQLMQAYGLPKDEEFGVLNPAASDQAAFATMLRTSHQTVQRLDDENGELTSVSVEKVTAYPFAVSPATELLEIYAGSISGIEQLGVFFSSCLGLPTVVEPLEVDVISAIDKLSASTQRFQLRSVRVSDYAHNSFMLGPYAPKFLDSEHGKDFLGEYAEQVQSAAVRFQGPGGRVTATLGQRACFSYSCNEEDQPAVKAVLRTLI